MGKKSENGHEMYRRFVKVETLTTAAESLGISRRDLSRADDQQWRALAILAESKTPSGETRRLVLELLAKRSRERKRYAYVRRLARKAGLEERGASCRAKKRRPNGKDYARPGSGQVAHRRRIREV